MHDLPFEDGKFETVYVDPPFAEFSFSSGFWPSEAWRVADERLVLECPGKRVHLPRTEKSWYLAEPNPGSSLMAVKLFQVFDRAGQLLESFGGAPA
jgi:16S rRNA G966 N2-methylase RsmD